MFCCSDSVRVDREVIRDSMWVISVLFSARHG